MLFYDCLVNVECHILPSDLASRSVVHMPPALVAHQFWIVGKLKKAWWEEFWNYSFYSAVEWGFANQVDMTVVQVTRGSCPDGGSHLLARVVLGQVNWKFREHGVDSLIRHVTGICGQLALPSASSKASIASMGLFRPSFNLLGRSWPTLPVKCHRLTCGLLWSRYSRQCAGRQMPHSNVMNDIRPCFGQPHRPSADLLVASARLSIHVKASWLVVRGKWYPNGMGGLAEPAIRQGGILYKLCHTRVTCLVINVTSNRLAPWIRQVPSE